MTIAGSVRIIYSARQAYKQVMSRDELSVRVVPGRDKAGEGGWICDLPSDYVPLCDRVCVSSQARPRLPGPGDAVRFGAITIL